jgi:hypothetical protein
MRNWIAKLSLLALLLPVPALLWAQDSASMAGTVTDTTGALVPDATVTLSNPLTGVSFKQTTNKAGFYRFANVPPNDGYTVAFTHDGFASVKVDKFTLQVGITRTQDAKLPAGSIETVSVVSGAEVTLNTTDASIGNNIDVQLLNDLPVYDRVGGITTLFTLQPGVDISSGAVTGARTDQTSVTVDGMDVNDIASNATFAIVGNAPVDSVDQFTGTVAGLNPNLGTGSGGQFQLVTKSGTNKFHGNINEYHRDTSTVANSWFNNLIDLPRTPLIQNQFGGAASGPILKNKLFFSFDVSASRIVQSTTVEQTVPLTSFYSATPTLNYINSNEGCDAQSRINTSPSCISSLTAAQVAGFDPAGIGFDPNVLTFLAGRYPAPNDQSYGDGVNTEGYRFTTPVPNNSTTYVAKIDYNLNKNHHLFIRGTMARQNAIESAPVFPSDPVTSPFIDRSYGYVGSDEWTIGKNKVNIFEYGDNISKYSFPKPYNPTGANQYNFSGLSTPYSGNGSQKRRVPIPTVRDDFNWTRGNHNLSFGGTFKFIKTDSNLINDYNFVGVGEQGSAIGNGLSSNLRPSDINQVGSAGVDDYDSLFTTGLGVIGTITTNYNYTNTGAAVPAGTGGPRHYRYFETELYAGDTWRLNSKLTLTYGLRYQLYSVPYESKGEESVEITDSTSQSKTSLNSYIAARQAANAGNPSITPLPIYSVILGGKANNGPNLYAPSYKDFAPRVAFAYNPTPKTVINGGAGIVYDRTVINAVNFLQDQISYLFSNQQVAQFGGSTPTASLVADTRLGSNLSYPASLNPPPAPLTVPYTPYVSDGFAYGLAAGETNFVISPTLKDPYSFAFNLGVQQELPGKMIVRLNYVGRLGRRLLGDADAGQVLDVPDYTGQSTQSMAQAFAGLTTQTRACQNAGVANCNLTPQPWFENALGTGYQSVLGNNTNLVAGMVGQLAPRGDMSDMLYTMAAYSDYYGFSGFLPQNVGIPSQFGSNAYLTNQGNSTYHAFLLTLSKNLSHGLRFDLNYTWSHSIDNTSLSSANNALYNNFGFICDITQPRACRGNSDFDVTSEISSDFVYDLPFGKGKTFAGHSPLWLNELIGGWSIAGLPSFRTGLAVTPYSDTYLASFDNQNPAIFTGNKGDLKSKVNTNLSSQTVYGFAGGAAGAAKVLSEFRGPIGLEYGSRNTVRGPDYVNLDSGLAKVFPLYPEKGLNLKFRADFYNIFNHPSFGTPALNIVTNQSNFGQITGTSSGYRVGQFSLRLEF